MKKKKNGVIYSAFGLVCAIISLLFFPIIFGPLAIILGYLGRKNGDKTFGLVVMILGAVFMAIGMILGVAVYMWMQSAAGNFFV